MKHIRTTLFLSASMLLGVLVIAACGGSPDPTPTPTYVLEVTVAGPGGTVTSSPAGINVSSGSATASATFESGTAVTLTATAAANHVFVGWSGDCSGTGACVVTMDDDAAVTATFQAITATLTVGIDGSGNGNVTSVVGIDVEADLKQVTLPVGTEVTLNVTVEAGTTFLGWSAACSAVNECTFTLEGDLTVNAILIDADVDLVTSSFSIAQGSDDAEEFLSDFVNPGGFFEGGVTLTSSDIDLTFDADFNVVVAVGLRFAGVTVPDNAIITAASITFSRILGATQPGSVTLSLAGHASDGAPTFVGGSANFDITSRPTTSADVNWSWVGPWNAATATSPNIASVVSEIVQRPGWSSGNAIAFVITSDDSDGNNYRRAQSFETAGGVPASLSISYYVPGTP